MTDRDDSEKQRAEEYAALAGQIHRTILDRVLFYSKTSVLGIMTSSAIAGDYRFVETFSAESDRAKFSIWYLGLSPTKKTSYYVENGQVTKEGPTNGWVVKTGKFPLVSLGELRMVAQLINDPAGNTQIVARLPRSPIK